MGQPIGDTLTSLLFSEVPAEQYAADWALYVLGKGRLWTPPAQPDVLGRLFWLWRNSPYEAPGDAFADTLAHQRVVARDTPRGNTIAVDELMSVLAQYDDLKPYNEQPAALIVAWYRRAWPDAHLVAKAKEILERLIRDSIRRGLRSSIEEMLEHLGNEQRGSGENRTRRSAPRRT